MTKTNKQEKPAEVDNAPAPKRRWLRVLSIVIVAIVAVIIILITVVFSATRAPVKVSDQLMSALRASNLSAAYSLFAPEAQQATPQAQFNKVMAPVAETLKNQPKLVSRGIDKQTGKDATAKIEYDAIGNDGQTYRVTTNLVKHGDKWQVLNFESVKK